MRIIPAIDLIDGKCVRLSKGDYNTQKTYSENPLEVAKAFEAHGIKYLHLVDLDGAKSKHIVNYKVLETIASKTSLKIDFGGGLKSNADLKIAFESGAPDTVDPLAGSYFIESLTAEVEKKAWELIAKIDAMGGSVAAIESGFMQDEIAKSAYAYQKDIESGEKIIVGVNKFTIDEAPTNIAFKIDDSIRQVQIEKINTLKQNRDNTKVVACLDAITTAAKGTDNIMPLVVEAVENKATLGEISNALRLVFGEF